MGSVNSRVAKVAIDICTAFISTLNANGFWRAFAKIKNAATPTVAVSTGRSLSAWGEILLCLKNMRIKNVKAKTIPSTMNKNITIPGSESK